MLVKAIVQDRLVVHPLHQAARRGKPYSALVIHHNSALWGQANALRGNGTWEQVITDKVHNRQVAVRLVHQLVLSALNQLLVGQQQQQADLPQQLVSPQPLVDPLQLVRAGVHRVVVNHRLAVHPALAPEVAPLPVLALVGQLQQIVREEKDK